MGMVIRWELYKKLKFDHITKDYMQKNSNRPRKWDI